MAPRIGPGYMTHVPGREHGPPGVRQARSRRGTPGRSRGGPLGVQKVAHTWAFQEVAPPRVQNVAHTGRSRGGTAAGQKNAPYPSARVAPPGVQRWPPWGFRGLGPPGVRIAAHPGEGDERHPSTSGPPRRKTRRTRATDAGQCRGGSGGSGPRAGIAAHREGDETSPSAAQGSPSRVEVAGIEPASFSALPGLLRAQPALFSQPRRSCRPAADGLSRCWCPSRPRGRAG